jgi:hypothetical protein
MNLLLKTIRNAIIIKLGTEIGGEIFETMYPPAYETIENFVEFIKERKRRKREEKPEGVN